MTRFEELKENLTIDDLIDITFDLNNCKTCLYRNDKIKCRCGEGCTNAFREYLNQEVKYE